MFVIRVDLDRELVMRKEELDQQRKSVRLRRSFAHHVASELRRNLAKRFAGQRTIRDQALISGKPRFANGLLARRFRIDWRKIASTPDTFTKEGLEKEWIQV